MLAASGGNESKVNLESSPHILLIIAECGLCSAARARQRLRDAGASVSAGDYVLTQDLTQCLAFWKYSLDWHRSNADPGRPDVGQSDNFNAKYLSFNQ